MYKKPTYEQLEKKIKILEAQVQCFNGLKLQTLFVGLESSFPIGITDSRGQIIYINESLMRMWGYSKKNEILGRNLTEFWCGDRIFNTLKVLQENGYSKGEDKGKRKDGSVFDVQYVAMMCNNDDGKPEYMLGQFFDITVRKQAEEKLEETLLFNEKVVSESPVGISIYDVITGQCITANKAIADLVGGSIKQVMSQNLYEIESWKKSGLLETAKTAVEEKTKKHHVTELETTFGKSLIVDCYFAPLIFKEKWHLLLAATDITLQVRAEEAFLKSELNYRDLVQSANSIILRINKDGKITFFNKYAQEFFGYSEKEIIGRNAIGTIIPERDSSGRNLKEMFYEITINPEKYVQNENENIKANGEHVWVSWTNKAINDSSGDLMEILSIGNDITEKLKIENQLRQAQKMESVGVLAGGIAHDFNNILSSVIGFTELCLDEAQPGTTLEDNLQEVYAAGSRAKDLVWQILAFARQSEEKNKPIRVDYIVKEVLKLIRSTIPTTIEIKQEIKSDSLIMGNPTLIHQIVMNLCTNAAHAMEDSGGILQVTVKDVAIDRTSEKRKKGLRQGEYIKVKVSDTGTGIHEKIIRSIFDPFFTTKAPGEGTGMGLSVVQGIVDKSGGKVTVDSQVGKGTTFSVYLPITKKRRTPLMHETEELQQGTERILLIDDEEPIAKMGSRVLESLGYRATMRTSSVEALELFRTKPYDFDLIITDMTMPNMTGDILAVELMKIRADLPVILCTGYSNKISEENASEIGIKAFIYKPIIKRDLAKTVRKVLDEAES